MKNKNSILYKTKDYIAFKFVDFLFYISKYIPICVINTICGILAVLFCPFVPATKTAFKNIRKIKPELKIGEVINLIFNVWYHLGLFAGEFAYVYSMKEEDFKEKIYSSEETNKMLDKIKNSNKGAILFSAHFSNWEMGLRYLTKFGFKINVVFRKSNNEKIENKYIKGLREQYGINMIAKGNNAAIKILKALKNKEVVIILADQRDDRGELIDFMGQECHTNTSTSALALRGNADIYGIRVIRKDTKAKFEFKCDSYINIDDYQNLDIKTSTTNITKSINNIIASWINKNPEQWFWVHNRWKK